MKQVKQALNPSKLEEFVNELEDYFQGLDRSTTGVPGIAKGDNKYTLFASSKTVSGETKTNSFGVIYGKPGQTQRYSAIIVDYTGPKLAHEEEINEGIARISQKYKA